MSYIAHLTGTARNPLTAVSLISFMALSCGGGGGSSNNTAPPPPTSNTQGIVVNSGPAGNYANGAFTTVAICSPGTQTCQSIDGILVDTGSYGLRILSGAISSSLSLPQQTTAGGQPVAECAEFAASLVWGPVKSADVQLAQLKASSVPIQVVGDPNYPDSAIPSNCSSSGLPPNDTLATLGANGILGVGVFTDDCGPACATTGTSNPGVYYACPTPSTCAVTAEAEANQLQNPVWLMTSDNNGLSIALPSVPDAGSLTVTGTLTLGIGTQSNNGLGNSTIFPVDGSGNFVTEYNGTKYPVSYIDSGSGAIFYLDSATTGIPECTGSLAGFYCPSGPVAQTATNFGATGSASNTVMFSIANAGTLLSSPNTAFINLGGTNPSSVDWGLPFFYGRTVFVAIDGQTTPAGLGPYWAY